MGEHPRADGWYVKNSRGHVVADVTFPGHAQVRESRHGDNLDPCTAA